MSIARLPERAGRRSALADVTQTHNPQKVDAPLHALQETGEDTPDRSRVCDLKKKVNRLSLPKRKNSHGALSSTGYSPCRKPEDMSNEASPLSARISSNRVLLPSPHTTCSPKGSETSGFMDLSSQDVDELSQPLPKQRSFMAKEKLPVNAKKTKGRLIDMLDDGQRLPHSATSTYGVSPEIPLIVNCPMQTTTCGVADQTEEVKDSGSESLFGSQAGSSFGGSLGSFHLIVPTVCSENLAKGQGGSIQTESTRRSTTQTREISGKSKIARETKQSIMQERLSLLADFTDSDESDQSNKLDTAVNSNTKNTSLKQKMISSVQFTSSEEEIENQPLRNGDKKLVVQKRPVTATTRTKKKSVKSTKEKPKTKKTNMMKLSAVCEFTDSDEDKNISLPTAKISTHPSTVRASMVKMAEPVLKASASPPSCNNGRAYLKKKLTEIIHFTSSEDEDSSSQSVCSTTNSIDLLSRQLDDILSSSKNRKRRVQKREKSAGEGQRARYPSADVTNSSSIGTSSISDISVLSQQLEELLSQKPSKKKSRKKDVTSHKKEKSGGRKNTKSSISSNEVVHIPETQPATAENHNATFVPESVSQSPHHTRLVMDSTELDGKLLVSDSATGSTNTKSPTLQSKTFFKSVFEVESDECDELVKNRHQETFVPNSADVSPSSTPPRPAHNDMFDMDAVPDSQPIHCTREQENPPITPAKNTTPHLPANQHGNRIRSPQLLDLHLKVSVSPGSGKRKHNTYKPTVMCTSPNNYPATSKNITMKSPNSEPYTCNISLQVSLPQTESSPETSRGSPDSADCKSVDYDADSSRSAACSVTSPASCEMKDISMQVSLGSPEESVTGSPGSPDHPGCLAENQECGAEVTTEEDNVAKKRLQVPLSQDVPSSPVWTMLKSLRDGIGKVVGRSSEKTARGKLNFDGTAEQLTDSESDENNVSAQWQQREVAKCELTEESDNDKSLVNDESVCIPESCMQLCTNDSADIEIIYPPEREENNNKASDAHCDISQIRSTENNGSSSDAESTHSEPDAFKTCLDLSVEDSSQEEEDSAEATGPKPDIRDNSSDEDDFENFLEHFKTPRRLSIQKEREKDMEDFIVNDSDISSDDEEVFYNRTDNEHVSAGKRLGKGARPAPHHLMSSSENDSDSESEAEQRPDVRVKPSSTGAGIFLTPQNPPAKPKSWTTRPVVSKGIGEHYHGDRVDTIATPFRTPVELQCGRPTSPRDPACYSFLRSLSFSVSDATRHPDSVRFVKNFKKTKEDLCTKLFGLFNQTVFDNQLPADLNIKWNTRLLKTAGFCAYRRQTSQAEVPRTARIELSVKVCDSPERVRDTLIHELCHAAVWLLHGVNGGHGPHWKFWAKKASRVHPDLPAIARCHSYVINYKFIYRCTKCGYQVGRHSKSLNTENKICGHCRSPFELLQNTPKGLTNTPHRRATPNSFAMFVKRNYASVKRPGIAHADVMRTLSADFAKAKIDD